MPRLKQSDVQAAFDYNRETGQLIRKSTDRRNVRFVGKPVGSLTKNGYLVCSLKNKIHYCHRLVWLYHHGYLPENDIDHINRDKTDNRLENLREVSRQCNLRNGQQIISTSSCVKGVAWSKREKKWTARICINQKHKSLGNYHAFENAVCARLAAEQCLGWSGCDSNSPAYKYVSKNITKKGR